MSDVTSWPEIEKFLEEQEATRKSNELARIENENKRMAWEENTIKEYVNDLCDEGQAIDTICKETANSIANARMDEFNETVNAATTAANDAAKTCDEASASYAKQTAEASNKYASETAASKAEYENKYNSINGRMSDLIAGANGSQIGKITFDIEDEIVPTIRLTKTLIFPKAFSSIPNVNVELISDTTDTQWFSCHVAGVNKTGCTVVLAYTGGGSFTTQTTISVQWCAWLSSEVPTEVSDARTDASGSSHTSLKDRLDTEYTQLSGEVGELGIKAGIGTNAVIGSTGWVVGSNNKCCIKACEPGSEFSITAGAMTTSYAFLRSFTEAIQGETPDYCDGYGETLLPDHQTNTGMVPDDCNYLYVTVYDVVDCTPSSFVVGGYDWAKDIKENLLSIKEATVAEAQTVIDAGKADIEAILEAESKVTEEAKEATTKATEATKAVQMATIAAQTATSNADTATTKANAAASAAATAAATANVAAETAERYGNDANQAAKEAETWTVNAMTATSNANTATENANAATESAKTATDTANAAASAATNAATSAANAAEAAWRAKNNANDATDSADKAAKAANTAASAADTAASNADTATTNANTAAETANTAAGKADTATAAAKSATDLATTAAGKANAATSKANTSAAKADTAAANADTATSAAKSATSAAESATTAAKDATTKATASASACDTATAAAKTATTNADTATGKANAATSKAETAAANADTATTAAKTATTNANTAAETANTAAGKADTATANATAAATSATNAATAANTAAALANSASQIYGVRFDGSASAGTRLGAAVGLVANPSTDTVRGENDFDSIYPWAGIRMVNGKMTDNGYVVTAVDGQEAFTTTEDTMVQIPLFWYKEEEVDGSTYTWVSPVRQAGWQPNPMCIRKDGTLAEYGYMAAFRLNWSDGTYADNSTTATPQSVAGAESAWNISLTDTINAAKRKGANWTCTRIEDIQALRVLFEVEFANRNTQAIMQGNVNTTTVAATSAGEGQFITTNSLANFNVGMWVGLGTDIWNYGTSSRSVKIASIENGVVTFEDFTGTIAAGTVMWNAPSPNGACLDVLGASGSPHSNTDGRHPCRYRYIEQPWGDSWEWVSNLLINSIANGVQEPYYLADPSLYTGSITDDYEQLSYDMPATTGYISHLGTDESKPFVRLADTMGGGTSTYYGDYYWKGDSAGTRAVIFGGAAGHGSLAGLSYFYVNYAPSTRYVNLRSRLSLAPA